MISAYQNNKKIYRKKSVSLYILDSRLRGVQKNMS